MSEFDIPLNTPEGQRLLGARDVIAEEAFTIIVEGKVGGDATNPSAILHVTDPGEIPVEGPINFAVFGPGAFSIHHTSGDPIFAIHADGRLEINPAFTVDEAARAFWDAVIRLNPYQPVSQEPKP